MSFFLFILFESQITERDREFFHLLVRFLNVCNGQSWASWGQELLLRLPQGHLNHPHSASFPGTLTRNWIRIRIAWTRTNRPCGMLVLEARVSLVAPQHWSCTNIFNVNLIQFNVFLAIYKVLCQKILLLLWYNIHMIFILTIFKHPLW